LWGLGLIHNDPSIYHGLGGAGLAKRLYATVSEYLTSVMGMMASLMLDQLGRSMKTTKLT